MCYWWSSSHTSPSVCCCRKSRSHTLQLSPWTVLEGLPSMLMVEIGVDLGRGWLSWYWCSWWWWRSQSQSLKDGDLLESLGGCPSYFELCSYAVGTHGSPGSKYTIGQFYYCAILDWCSISHFPSFIGVADLEEMATIMKKNNLNIALVGDDGW